MSLIRFKQHAPVRSNLENFFNDFFEGEFGQEHIRGAGFVPAANVKETEKAFHIELAVPGMEKEDFQIELNVDLLTVKTEKKEENKEEGERFSKREFSIRSFERSFRLPDNIDFEKINARYQNGILKLEIGRAHV